MHGFVKLPVADLWRTIKDQLETQLLKNEPVVIHKEEEEWFYVAAPEQARFRKELGWHPYPGWMRRSAITLLPELPPRPPVKATLDRKRIITDAITYLGVPYLWGGRSKKGVDCSGLVNLLYRAQGILIPRDAQDQCLKSARIEHKDLLPGDLVFFTPQSKPERVTHVALYIDSHRCIEAPESGKLVSYLPSEKLAERTQKYTLSYGKISNSL